MKDPRFRIYEKLLSALSEVSTPKYTVIPANTAKPFIYLGDIQLAEIAGKSDFITEGFISIEYYTGSNAFVGSLTPMLTELSNIKYLLAPHKGYTIDLAPEFKMVYWKLTSDTGFIQYSSTERLFVATLQYSFSLTEEEGNIQRIITDGGTLESISCIPISLR